MSGVQAMDSDSYARAMLNILSDVEDEKARLRDSQRALLNILEDASAEERHLQQTQRAVLNILEDVEAERHERQRAETAVRALNEDLEERVAQRTAALSTANQELESFSYTVSHDLRAPLRTIDGFSLVLLEDYAGRLDPEGQDALHRVRDATQRMGHLIDDMLTLGRVSRSEATIGPVDVSALVRAVVDELQAAQPRPEMSLAVADAVLAQADAGLLRTAIENLVGNAWKFTSKTPAPRIAFTAGRRDGELVCTIADNGAGFDMAFAQNLFVPFQRLHRVTDFAGNGVGLATVKRVITRLGGRIWAEGRVGNGAAFHFTLPEARNTTQKGD